MSRIFSEMYGEVPEAQKEAQGVIDAFEGLDADSIIGIIRSLEDKRSADLFDQLAQPNVKTMFRLAKAMGVLQELGEMTDEKIRQHLSEQENLLQAQKYVKDLENLGIIALKKIK